MKRIVIALGVLLSLTILALIVLNPNGRASGWEGTRGACVAVMVLGAAGVLAQWLEMKEGSPRAPARRGGQPGQRDFDRRVFRLATRERLTITLGSLAGAALLLGLGTLVGHLVAPDTVTVAHLVVFGALALVPAAVFGSCAWAAWNARVVLGPDGGSVRMVMHSTGKFKWDALVAFERVTLPDPNLGARGWFRFVTAKKSYLFPDEVKDREELVRTVTRATGLELTEVR